MANVSKTGAPSVNPSAQLVQGGTTAPRMLGEGDHGPDVVALQKQLSALGFAPGAPDGQMGPKTVAAVKRFQAAQKLPADGKVGHDTRASLDKVAGHPSRDANGISREASKAAAAKGGQATIATYGEKSRLEEQQAAAKDTLSRLTENAKVAGIAAIPIFWPAAIAIAAQENANIIQRYENEVPQKDLSVITAEEDEKANKAILALPGQYADGGLAALQAVQDAALSGAGVVASAWNSTLDSVSSAYDAAVNAGSAAVTQAEEAGGRLVDSAGSAAHDAWHWATTPVRAIGSWLSGVGKD